MKFVAFRTLIENEIGNPNTNDASSSRVRTLILQWTNQAYREICQAFDWPWLQGTNTQSVAAAAQSFAIPTPSSTSLKQILDLFDTTYDPERKIVIVPMEEFRTGQYETDANGETDYAAFWGGTIYLDRPLAATTSFRYRYVAYPAELNASDNTNLGTEILVPEPDLFVLQDGIMAYWYRYRKDPMFTSQMQLFRQRIKEMADRCRRGPDFFYPSEQRPTYDPNQRGYRVIIT